MEPKELETNNVISSLKKMNLLKLSCEKGEKKKHVSAELPLQSYILFTRRFTKSLEIRH